MRKEKFIFGTISHATFIDRDLLETFSSVLYELSTANRKYSEYKEVIKEAKQLLKKSEWNNEEKETVSYLVNEKLCNGLNDFAPKYFHFGSHEGDGSDFGFWLSIDFVNEFEGLKVSDLSEVPKNYSGEILVINDHGNLSLYLKFKTSQKLHKIWSLV